MFKSVLILCCLACACSLNASDNWPAFRGLNNAGIADNKPLPTSWSMETGENIRWKTAIPGLGHAGPVIWGNRIYITTAISGLKAPELKAGLYGDIKPVKDDSVHKWIMYCLDKKTGKIKWEKLLHEGVPKIKRHTKATHANSTPATDGKYLVNFLGSEGLYCHDMDGNLIWKKDLGVLDSGFFRVPDAQWGFGSSPVIHDGVIYLQVDVQKDSYVAALDLKTGKEKWKTARNDVPTWCTPVIHNHNGRLMMLVSGYKHAGAYDAKTGEEIWKITDGGDIPVASPVVGHGMVYISTSHGPKRPLYAVRLDAKGDLTLKDGETSNEGIAWSHPSGASYMPSPLLYGDYLYVTKDNGILSAYNAKTGEEAYKQRLGGAYTGSAVAGDGKIYITSEEGTTLVVKAGPKYEVVGEGSVDGVVLTSAAISDGAIYIRTRDHLVAIGSK
ncbi:MAG: PQQ-binding-like beta-propeller repeat protein [Acidobacteriota bacterium]|nr:PQQ-binding-like beta-propeller repeat protein [Acidobacteriota bacterium]